LFGDGDTFAVTAGPEGARFVLAAGRPLREPLVVAVLVKQVAQGADDRGRVQSARQQHARWHVGAQAQAHGVGQQFLELLGRARVVLLGDPVQAPVAMYVEPAVVGAFASVMTSGGAVSPLSAKGSERFSGAC
ncbi:MAG TPA: hypothetical protein PLV92_16515, partial [Pirellulaceae bacterium]|nr:hypothetical protein [Pirellulaceae bacterium]